MVRSALCFVKHISQATIKSAIKNSCEDEHDRSVVARAFLEFQRQTCISFTPRDKEKDYIMITKGDGCSSQVGRVGGMQLVTLGDGCIYPGIVMHELMHAVGFWHEQSRWDRDDYVAVYYENIQPGKPKKYSKYMAQLAPSLLNLKSSTNTCKQEWKKTFER